MHLLKNRDMGENWTQLEVMMIIIRRSHCWVKSKYASKVRFSDREPINQHLGLNQQIESNGEKSISPPLLGPELRPAAIYRINCRFLLT